MKRFSFIYITILLAALALKGCNVEEPAETDSKSSVVDGDSTLDGGIAIQKYGQTGWGESPNNKNIGIIDHSLGATIATLTHP